MNDLILEEIFKYLDKVYKILGVKYLENNVGILVKIIDIMIIYNNLDQN